MHTVNPRDELFSALTMGLLNRASSACCDRFLTIITAHKAPSLLLNSLRQSHQTLPLSLPKYTFDIPDIWPGIKDSPSLKQANRVDTHSVLQFPMRTNISHPSSLVTRLGLFLPRQVQCFEFKHFAHRCSGFPGGGRSPAKHEQLPTC